MSATAYSATKATPPPTPQDVPLDAMLTAQQCAEWLQMSLRELQERTRERVIPVCEFTQKAKRYHPRTILSKFGAVTPQQIIQQIKP
jgi:hypothetical protein